MSSWKKTHRRAKIIERNNHLVGRPRRFPFFFFIQFTILQLSILELVKKVVFCNIIPIILFSSLSSNKYQYLFSCIDDDLHSHTTANPFSWNISNYFGWRYLLDFDLFVNIANLHVLDMVSREMWKNVNMDQIDVIVYCISCGWEYQIDSRIGELARATLVPEMRYLKYIWDCCESERIYFMSSVSTEKQIKLVKLFLRVSNLTKHTSISMNTTALRNNLIWSHNMLQTSIGISISLTKKSRDLLHFFSFLYSFSSLLLMSNKIYFQLIQVKYLAYVTVQIKLFFDDLSFSTSLNE